jgi:hypothetical protein
MEVIEPQSKGRSMTGVLSMQQERRDGQRFGISAPLTVMNGSREISAFTRDLSNRGVYFYLASSEGSLIARDFDFIVELPPEITLSTCCSIRCRGRVVRTESAASDLTGIAAEILDYSIRREAAAVA